MNIQRVSLEDLPKRYQALTKARVARCVKAIQVTCAMEMPRILASVVASTQPQPVDRGEYIRNWKTFNLDKGCMIYNPLKYAGVIELGRRPGGKMPPIDALQGWVHRKGLVKAADVKARRRAVTAKAGILARAVAVLKRSPRSAREMAERQVAFAIARKIRRDGTKPRRILGRVWDELEFILREEVNRAAQE